MCCWLRLAYAEWVWEETKVECVFTDRCWEPGIGGVVVHDRFMMVLMWWSYDTQIKNVRCKLRDTAYNLGAAVPQPLAPTYTREPNTKIISTYRFSILLFLLKLHAHPLTPKKKCVPVGGTWHRWHTKKGLPLLYYPITYCMSTAP